MGSLFFLFPLLIWLRYSERIASNGGLYAFVEAAAGAPVARVQAIFWIISYVLYLVYTVPFIVYDLLPVVVPQVSRYQLLLDAGLAVIVAGVMLSPKIVAFSVMALIAVVQLLLAVALAGVSLRQFGVPLGSFVGHGDLGTVLVGAGKTSSLYVCASLPLFVAGEVRGGPSAVRRTLGWAFAGVATLSVIAVFPLGRAAASVIGSDIPGVPVAQASFGRMGAVLIGVGVAASVAGLIVAEFIALSRLLGTMFLGPSRMMVIIISAVFLAASLISLVNPPAVYRLLLKPSLIALWISQLIVVGVYPWFVHRYRRVLPSDVALAAAGSVLMVFALVIAAISSSGT